MGSRKKKPKADIDKFYMSAHYGVCLEADEVREILIKEKSVWRGQASGNTTLSISRENLFGGIMKEGGVSGYIDIMFGRPTQKASSWLASKLGRTPDTAPAYRGMLSLVFRGAGRGFYWTASTPYLGTIWTRVARYPRSLDPQTAKILRREAQDGDTFDANPAHIIFECVTNTDWGLGWSYEGIDVASFQRAAQTLFDERFGLSLVWAQSSTTEAFVNDILDCISGSIFTNPRNGKLTLRLIRDDYDVDTLHVINPDNAKLTNFARKSWGETVNEVKVTWTNPANETAETVYAQDLGNIAVQGAVVSDAKNYHGVRRVSLAQQLANRDLRQAAAALCSCEATVDRSLWDLAPFDCVKLTWPEYGVEEIHMRVVNINYGATGSSTIKLSLLEDVFSLPAVTFVKPPVSEWEDPEVPTGAVELGRVWPCPAYFAAQIGYLPGEYDFPLTAASLLVVSPGGAAVTGYAYEVEEPTPAGGLEWSQVSTPRLFLGKAVLADELTGEVLSQVRLDEVTAGYFVEANTFLLIGPSAAPAEDLEVALVTEVSESGELTVLRGALDTVPRNWPVGTDVWFGSIDDFTPVEEAYVAGQTGRFRIGNEFGEPTIFSGEIPSRPSRPLRPASVKINGVAFGGLDKPTDGILNFSWAHRNRLMEDVAVLPWDAVSAIPEPGVTYRVEADAYAGSTLLESNWFSENAGADETFQLDLTGVSDPPAGTSELRFRVVAERDGEDSWQNLELSVYVLSGQTNLSGKNHDLYTYLG